MKFLFISFVVTSAWSILWLAAFYTYCSIRHDIDPKGVLFCIAFFLIAARNYILWREAKALSVKNKMRNSLERGQ